MAQAKRATSSEVTRTELVLPHHTNALGSIFGGVIMSWIDITAAISAQRHSGKTCVTASIDELHFLSPATKGMIVNTRAKVSAVFNRSCEVIVIVESEHPHTHEKKIIAQAFLTFVAIDEKGKAISMPPLECSGDVEQARQKQAEDRRTRRIKSKKELIELSKIF